MTDTFDNTYTSSLTSGAHYYGFLIKGKGYKKLTGVLGLPKGAYPNSDIHFVVEVDNRTVYEYKVDSYYNDSPIKPIPFEIDISNAEVVYIRFPYEVLNGMNVDKGYVTTVFDGQFSK